MTENDPHKLMLIMITHSPAAFDSRDSGLADGNDVLIFDNDYIKIYLLLLGCY